MLRAAVGAELSGILEQGDRERAPARRPVVLLHGFAGWSRGLLPLEHFLRRMLSRKVIRIGLGPGLDRLDGAALRAALAIERTADVHGSERIDVVGHSMGGLVATHLLKILDRGKRLRTVVTLGAPHRGTPLALAGARLLGRLGPSLAQMAPGSRFLADLAREPVPEGSALYSVAGLADLVVPAPCARLPRCARHYNRSIERAGHWDLVFRADAQAAVARLLRGRGDSDAEDERRQHARARLRVVQ